MPEVDNNGIDPGRVRVDRSHGPVAVAPLLPPSWYGPCKRAFDVAIGAALLVLTAPLLLLIAALVKLTSRGPVIYTQERVGRDGRVYRLYKVRSMYHGCE